VSFRSRERCVDAVQEHTNENKLGMPKRLALYYYTVEKDEKFTARSTDYFARPQDSRGKAAMIWLDKKAVDLYSRAKARFGFSDGFASRVLGWLSGKK